MAISTPAKVGTDTTNTTQGASTALTPGAGLTIGDTAFLFASSNVAAIGVSSVTDNASNTWAVDHIADTNASGNRTSLCRATIASVPTSITVNWSAATSKTTGLSLFRVTGLEQSSTPLDKTNKGGASGSGAITSPLTTTTAIANELLWGFACTLTGSKTATAGTNWTEISDYAMGSGGHHIDYRIVSATGTYQASMTLSGATNTQYNIAIATYMEASAVAASIPNLAMAPYRGTR
jgi:hypothetical protein